LGCREKEKEEAPNHKKEEKKGEVVQEGATLQKVYSLEKNRKKEFALFPLKSCAP